jgi:hypothetical protein
MARVSDGASGFDGGPRGRPCPPSSRFRSGRSGDQSVEQESCCVHAGAAANHTHYERGKDAGRRANSPADIAANRHARHYEKFLHARPEVVPLLRRSAAPRATSREAEAETSRRAGETNSDQPALFLSSNSCGSHNSTLLPSGSLIHANFPFSCDSGPLRISTPAARRFASSPVRSSTR